jgi:hypothetical protein
VLGLDVTSPKGQTWSIAPHIGGGLPSAEGGFETPLGWYGVQWKLGSNTLTANITTPTGTSGKFRVPKGYAGVLTVDNTFPASVKEGQEWSLAGGRHNLSLTWS